MKYTVMPTSTSPYSTSVRGRRRFNANDPKYRCCCGGQCHVRTGSMFVGASEIIIIALAMIAASVWFVYDGHRQAHQLRYGLNRDRALDENPDPPKFVFTQWSIIWLAVCLVSGVVFVLTVGLLFVGVIKERRYLFLPHMITQILFILGLTVLLGYCILLVVLATDRLMDILDHHPNDEYKRQDAVYKLVLRCVATVGCIIGIITFSSFFWIITRAYMYLRDSTAYERKVRQDKITLSPGSTMSRGQNVKLLYT